MVVESFVAEHKRMQALGQGHQPMLDSSAGAAGHVVPRHRITQTEALVDLQEQRAAAVAGDVAAAELDLYPLSCEGWRGQRTLVASAMAGLLSCRVSTP